MICAPIIALVEIATSGALSAAIGSALGSQILGGAVLGLVASGGKPQGALLGGLTAAFAGTLGGAAAEAGETASTTAKLAADTVGNDVAGSVTGLQELGEAGGYAADAARGAGEGLKELGEAGGYGASGAASKAGEVVKAADKVKPAGGLMSRIEGIAKEYPTMTKIGMGAIQGIGQQKMNEDSWKLRAQLEDENDRKARERAYKGADTSLGFRPSGSGYRTPLQKYLEGAQ